MAETLNLYQKLLKITEKIGKIEKTGKNQQQGYGFIEQAKIVAELRPLLAEYGVIIIPETVDRKVDRYEVTRSNGREGVDIHVNVTSRYTVINVDNPEERFVSEWNGGEAIDSSDKATNKAITASQKYFLMKLFNISDKDDGDNDSPELGSTRRAPVVNKASEKQVKTIYDTVKRITGADNADDIEAWLEKATGARTSQLTTRSAGAIITKLFAAEKSRKDERSPDLDTVVDVDVTKELTLADLPY